MIRHEMVGSGASVLLITLDRQARKNALTIEGWEALAATVGAAEPRRARAIVITGAGDTFCAGADLGEAGAEMASVIEAVFGVVRDCPIPVIGHINGAAVGAGAQLAVSCDLRVVSPQARFRVPAAAISLPVHPGTISRMVALAGAGAARAMLLGGDWIEAERAYALGLADRVGELDAAIAWASEIATYAPLALRYLKQQLQLANPPDSAGYAQALRRILDSEDHAEAVRARKERRPAVYIGR